VAYGAPVGPTTNGFAVASLVLGIAGFLLCFVGGILALVFGYKARREIDASGGRQTGRGMAVAGIVLGWVWVGLALAYVAVIVIVAIADSGSS
jgi:peptidoglycan/LPS O-acetylase OafA/YrhL